MRLAFLTTLTMIAFASNSILTRMAVKDDAIDPSAFALVRVLSGAIVLCLIVAARNRQALTFSRTNLPGAISLAVYMIGFSLAALTLDAGLGALILFGVVQIIMFGHSALTDRRPTAGQCAGAVVAFSGLVLALAPGPAGQTDTTGAFLMVAGGVGWAAYSIIGRGAGDPVVATMQSFVLCFPLLLVLFIWMDLSFGLFGIFLAVLSGGVTSGLGYALWYSVLPGLHGATAAIVQLSVPIIAILVGAVLLGEAITLSIVAATVLVIGGIAWAIVARPRVDV
jgi:drug/metabolite transporter (DMT)-like permease